MQAQQSARAVQVLQNSVIVFSRQYLPLARTTVKRAVALLISGKAEALALTGGQQWELCSPSVVLRVSEHIRLVNSTPEHCWKVPPVSRRGVLRRDNYTCQYCGSNTHLTLDHIIPRSKGGAHTWSNLVTACVGCNTRKGNRWLSDSGLMLCQRPRVPVHPALTLAEQFWNHPITGNDGISDTCNEGYQ